VFARLSLDVGPENIAETAYKLGIRTPLDDKGAYVPSMGLGSRVVTPMDMASAYATLAAGGIYSKPMAIRKVVIRGQVDTETGWGIPQRKRVIPDWVAAEVTRILGENMTSGTGVGANFGGLSAGKTGTTDNFADAWFCGFTPALQATVWIGYPKGEIPMTSVHGISVSGPTFPATIWRLFMSRAVAYAPYPREFPTPRSSPVWVSHELQYAMTGGYYNPQTSPQQTTTSSDGDGGSDGFVQVPEPGQEP
jgi:penicillin-binding protein 1A